MKTLIILLLSQYEIRLAYCALLRLRWLLPERVTIGAPRPSSTGNLLVVLVALEIAFLPLVKGVAR